MLHAFLLAITTGMRQGEILALRWKDINFESKTSR
ncbi:tyrosine-type recombinase/integrase [Shouchella clausii]|nr:tyrosine-type recombinase/integrase [Shouchella clausii]